MDPNLYRAASLQLQGRKVAQLHALAVSPGDPKSFELQVRKGLLLVAAFLLASGLIFWIAANWQEQSRLFKLSLIEGALALSVLAACLWPRMRLAGLLCATLVLGGLLAFVGQTYQTGADAWQLFAVWALLSLVWVGLSRSDVVWLVWVLIAAVGLAMWMGRFDLWDVFFARASRSLHTWINMSLWLLLALVPALVALVPFLRVRDGMGWWSHRMALACALTAWVGMALMHLFASWNRLEGAVFFLSAALVVVTLILSMRGRLEDFVSICLATLALNVLVISLVARGLFSLDLELSGLLLFGLLVLGCLGVSVRWLVTVQQRILTAAKEGAR